MHSLQKVHRTGTGRGPRAPTGTDSEDSFFTGAGHVYPHLDEAHAVEEDIETQLVGNCESDDEN